MSETVFEAVPAVESDEPPRPSVVMSYSVETP